MGKIEKIIVLVLGSIAAGIIIKELFDLISEDAGKDILEASFLIAGIIGVSYLVIRLLTKK